MRRSRWRLAVLWCVLVTGACARTVDRTIASPDGVATLDRRAPYLKAHMWDGSVYVLSPWAYDSVARRVTGSGRVLDMNRDLVRTGNLSLPLDSVALFETNVTRPAPPVAALAVITGASVAMTIYCAANPKACFGSCPTFYLSDGGSEVLAAEGFSASVAPSLEERDVDALFHARPTAREFTVWMRNEALETHVVRSVDLLAAPRRPGSRIVALPGGRFQEARTELGPERCHGRGGDDCLEAVRSFDRTEYFGLADSSDLAAREEVELTFPAVASGEVALVLASRQSLLPTFLLYQSFAYLGDSTGRWLAALERGGRPARYRAGSVARRLGGIEVLVRDSTGQWAVAGDVRETGPLAADVHAVPLPHTTGPVHVRLRLARGGWRIDYVALAVLGAPVTPERLPPARVLNNGTVDEQALAALRDSARTLVTFPGDDYALVYELPPDFERYELFLESRGYYLEWMRDEWSVERNPRLATELLRDPAAALRRLAPAYKRVEASMERLFWNSRYARR